MTVLESLGFINFMTSISDMVEEFDIPFDIREVLNCKAAISQFIKLDEEDESEQVLHSEV